MEEGKMGNLGEENAMAKCWETIREISQLLTGKKGLLDAKTPPEIVHTAACGIAILSQTHRLTTGDAIGAMEQAYEDMKRRFSWFQKSPLAQQLDLAIQMADLACVLKTKNFRQ